MYSNIPDDQLIYWALLGYFFMVILPVTWRVLYPDPGDEKNKDEKNRNDEDGYDEDDEEDDY